MSKWGTDYISTKFSPEEVEIMKEQYAKLLATYDRNSEKAFVDPRMNTIFKHDVSAKIYAKNNWVYDEFVVSRIEYYLGEGVIDILPNKDAVAKMFLDITKDISLHPRDKILALKEYANLMGFSENNIDSSTTNNVILIKDNGTDMTWEEKLKQQQQTLQDKINEKLKAH